MTPIIRSLVASSVAALALLAACKKDEPASTTNTTGSGVEIADPRATDQKNTKDDLDLARSVRQRLVADTTLSMRAKNALVVAQEGVVTLRGDVADQVEHNLVVTKVASTPGVVRIDDRLTSKEED